MGRDRGAAVVIEQAILPATVPGERRTGAFAWYNVLQDAGHAFGSLLAGLPVLLRRFGGMDEVGSFRGALVVNAALVLVPALLYLRLSRSVEAPGAQGTLSGEGSARAANAFRARLSPRSRSILF